MNWLFLRGLAREQRHFGDFLQRFAAEVEGSTAHVLDLPGFGTEHARASPAHIDAIVDDVRARHRARNGSGPCGVLAISLGGMVALRWAARFPSDFAAVVVVNTSAANLSPPHARFMPRAWPALARAQRQHGLERERTLLELTVNRRDLDLAAVAAEFATFAATAPPQRAATLRQLVAAARAGAPRNLSAPLLVLGSTADRLVDASCSQAIARHCGGTLALHATAGHDLPRDDPAWVIAQVRAWQNSGYGVQLR